MINDNLNDDDRFTTVNQKKLLKGAFLLVLLLG